MIARRRYHERRRRKASQSRSSSCETDSCCGGRCICGERERPSAVAPNQLVDCRRQAVWVAGVQAGCLGCSPAVGLQSSCWVAVQLLGCSPISYLRSARQKDSLHSSRRGFQSLPVVRRVGMAAVARELSNLWGRAAAKRSRAHRPSEMLTSSLIKSSQKGNPHCSRAVRRDVPRRLRRPETNATWYHRQDQRYARDAGIRSVGSTHTHAHLA